MVAYIIFKVAELLKIWTDEVVEIGVLERENQK